MHESFVLPYRTFDTLRWFTGRLWLRTSDWTTCCHSLPRYRKVAIYNAANMVRASLDRPTVCSRFRTAARVIGIKNADESLGDGRIS